MNHLALSLLFAIPPLAAQVVVDRRTALVIDPAEPGPLHQAALALAEYGKWQDFYRNDICVAAD